MSSLSGSASSREASGGSSIVRRESAIRVFQGLQLGFFRAYSYYTPDLFFSRIIEHVRYAAEAVATAGDRSSGRKGKRWLRAKCTGA